VSELSIGHEQAIAVQTIHFLSIMYMVDGAREPWRRGDLTARTSLLNSSNIICMICSQYRLCQGATMPRRLADKVASVTCTARGQGPKPCRPRSQPAAMSLG
jgi:hypothetical protein